MLRGAKAPSDGEPGGAAPRGRPAPALRFATTYLKGVAMGTADVIPGVSGGTVALIVGVYQDLLDSLGAFSRRAFLRPLARGRLSEAFDALNGPFLTPLLTGIVTALLVLAHVMGRLLELYPGQVFAFFFGLVAASALVVGRRVGSWKLAGSLALILGVAAGLAVVTLTPVTTPDTPLFLFLSGFLAICAMVLPGISGAFVLVLLGKYDAALAGLARLDLAIVVPIALGAVVGLVSFARLLSYLLWRHHDLMMPLLAGFILGSLYKVWPFMGPSGAPAWPWSTGAPWTALLMIVLILAGFLVVLALDKAGVSRSRATPPSRSSFSSPSGFTPRR